MRKGGGKAKGSSFERVISVELSKWMSKGEREDLLWRSSQSGGRATVAKRKNKDLKTQAGDISAIHPAGQPLLDIFYLECKDYKNLEYENLIKSNGQLLSFWKKTVEEAESYNRHPMLITKQNRFPIIIFVECTGAVILNLSEYNAIFASPKIDMYGYLLEDFVKEAKPL